MLLFYCLVCFWFGSIKREFKHPSFQIFSKIVPEKLIIMQQSPNEIKSVCEIITIIINFIKE